MKTALAGRFLARSAEDAHDDDSDDDEDDDRGRMVDEESCDAHHVPPFVQSTKNIIEINCISCQVSIELTYARLYKRTYRLRGWELRR